MPPRTGTDHPAVVCMGVAALDALVEVDALPDEDDRIPARSGLLAGGGPAATAAVTLARLGVSVAFVGQVGDDAAGEMIRAGLTRERVDTDMLKSVEGAHSPISVGLVRAEPARSRTLVAFSGTGGDLSFTPGAEEACRRAKWVHVDHAGWALARNMRSRGVTTRLSVDGGNPIDNLDLTAVDLFVPSQTELLRWSGRASVAEALEFALEAGAQVAVATQGAGGSRCLTSIEPSTRNLTRALEIGPPAGRSTRRWSVVVPAFPAEGSSTLGAGDVYHGALLAAIIRGDPMPKAMLFASAAAALSCRSLDGRSGIPTVQEVDGLMNGGPPGAPL